MFNSADWVNIGSDNLKEKLSSLNEALRKDPASCTETVQALAKDLILDKYGETALHVAAQQCYIKLVEALLKQGASVNLLNSSKDTPLGCVMMFSWNKPDATSVIETLMKAGANPLLGRFPPFDTALEQNSHSQWISLILTHDQNHLSKDLILGKLNKARNVSSVVTHYSSKSMICALTDYCLEKGYIDLFPSLDEAIKKFQTSFVAALLLNLDLNKVLQLDFRYYQQYIKDNDSDRLRSTMHIVEFLRKSQRTFMRKAAVENRMDVLRHVYFKEIVNDYADETNTVAMMVAQYGRVEMMEFLISMGDNCVAGNDTTQSPLREAIENGHRDMVELLLKKTQQNLNHDFGEGKTPLSLAYEKNQTEIATLLIQYGARQNAQSSSSATARPIINANLPPAKADFDAQAAEIARLKAELAELKRSRQPETYKN